MSRSTVCERARRASRPHGDVQAELIRLLQLPISTHEHKKIVKRVDELRRLFAALGPEQAKNLYARLTDESDPLAQFFDCELVTWLREELRETAKERASARPPRRVRPVDGLDRTTENPATSDTGIIKIKKEGAKDVVRCDTPVERALKKCIEGDRRWTMYLSATQRYVDKISQRTGRTLPERWQYFLTPKEYNRYTVPRVDDPFAHIRRKRPDELTKAIKACNDLEGMAGFKHHYGHLVELTSNSSLHLDLKGNLQLKVDRRSFLSMLSSEMRKKVEEELIGRAQDKAIKIVIGSELATILGWGLMLKEIRDKVQNRKLVNGDGKEWDQKRAKKKLWLNVDLLARDLARKRRGNVEKLKTWLWRNYHRYSDILNECEYYKRLEYTLRTGDKQSPSVVSPHN